MNDQIEHVSKKVHQIQLSSIDEISDEDLQDILHKISVKKSIIDDKNFYHNSDGVLIMDDKFNEDVVIPEGVTKLVIGMKFNSNLTLPDTLTELNLIRGGFDRDLILPPNLETFIMSDRYNKPLILPNSLKTLSMGDIYKLDLILPPNLENLTIGDKVPLSRDLPISLKKLSISLNNIPNLEKLINLEILKIKNRRIIEHLILPKNLKQLKLTRVEHGNIKFNENLKIFNMGEYFYSEVNLNEKLEELIMSSNFNSPISIPTSLKKLVLGGNFDQKITVYSDLEEIVYSYPYQIRNITGLTEKVKLIKLEAEKIREKYY